MFFFFFREFWNFFRGRVGSLGFGPVFSGGFLSLVKGALVFLDRRPVPFGGDDAFPFRHGDFHNRR